jgi:hypothetical protein
METLNSYCAVEQGQLDLPESPIEAPANQGDSDKTSDVVQCS